MEVGCPYCNGANTVDTGVSTRFQCAHCANVFEVGIQQPQTDTAAVLQFLYAQENDRGYKCPYCRSRRPPKVVSTTSSVGWIFFWVLLLFMCLPLCWIGLFITEQTTICPSCKTKIA